MTGFGARRRSPGGGRFGLVGAAGGARLALVMAIASTVALQVHSGLWSVHSWDLLVGVGALAGAVTAPLVLREGRGILPGLGMTTVAVAHAFVTATRRDGTSLALALALWLPAVVLGLVFNDEAQRFHSSENARRVPAPRSSAGGRRLLVSGLAAATGLAVVSAVATDVIRLPARGGLSGRVADQFWGNVARSGRTPTSLGTYQSSDQLDVGRRFQLSDQVVMKVRAAEPDYWRGTSYDHWDGRTWSRRPLPAGVDDPTSGGGSAWSQVEHQNLLQVFTVVAGGSDLLFGAYQAMQHVSPEGRSRTEADGTTTVARPLGPGARYAVVSSRPLVDADVLRRADAWAAPLPQGVAERYLNLPARPTRAGELARQVTAGQPTTYDKIRALERWIGDHTTYTLDIPPLPAGADAVDQFLFVDRKGYCEQIATSLAVMLRSIGVPTRLGVGYVSGQRSWSGDEFVVRSRDAHAWVEVWFPGVGWQAFDPTASVPLSGETSTSTRARAFPWLVGGAVTALLVVSALTGMRQVRRRRAVSWQKSVLSRVERMGAKRGRPRVPSETATEYARALGEGPLADPRLYEVGVALSRAAYGPDGLDAAERERIVRLLDDIAEAAPPPIRRRVRATVRS